MIPNDARWFSRIFFALTLLGLVFWLVPAHAQTFCSRNGPYTTCLGPDASYTTITEMPGGYTNIDTIPYGARPVVPPTVLRPRHQEPDRPLSRYLEEPAYLAPSGRSRRNQDALDAAEDDAEFEQLLRDLRR